jgi:serine/threonine protein kinase
MGIFSRRTRDQTDIKLIEQLHKQLFEESDVQAETQQRFVHPDKARRVVTREKIRDILSPFTWYDERYLTKIWDSMNLIICVLVWMKWDGWANFMNLFYPRGSTLEFSKFADNDLPVPEQTLGLFPGPDKIRFFQAQFIFKPVVILKDVHDWFDSRRPLPFLRVAPATSGSQGDILKVWVAERYLMYNERTSNNRPEVMALKTIKGEEGRRKINFDTEKRALEGFKRSLTTHDRIMQSFASFVHGSEFKILSPWAEGGDLHHFLYEPHKVMDDFPTRSRRFSPHALLTEACLLAQALEFLHGGLRAQNTVHMRCAHQDLKPENILICYPPNASERDLPVGQWKIGDFGLAMIEEEVIDHSRVVPMPPAAQLGTRAPVDVLREASFASFTGAKRGQGPFQPPEVQSVDDAKISTRRDVWSFGCILAMVFAFALGGPSEVLNQLQRRRSNVDELFYHRPHRLRRSSMHPAQTDAELKPDIRYWLDTHVFQELARGTASEWIGDCSQLIMQLLDCNGLQRPNIFHAARRLEMIIRTTRTDANERHWDFDQNIDFIPDIVPDSAPRPSNLVTRRDSLETRGDFVGVPTRSRGSSGPRSLNGGRLGSKSYKLDPSLAFTRLTSSGGCQHAVVDASASLASIWSVNHHFLSLTNYHRNATEACIYDLNKITDDGILWRDEPIETIEHDPSLQPLQRIMISDHATCERVTVSNSFVAVLEHHSTSSVRSLMHNMHVSWR